MDGDYGPGDAPGPDGSFGAGGGDGSIGDYQGGGRDASFSGPSFDFSNYSDEASGLSAGAYS